MTDALREMPHPFAAPGEAWTGTITLDTEAAGVMRELLDRCDLSASELLATALFALWREYHGIVLQPPTDEDLEAAMAESLADVAAGRTHSHEEVFGELRERYRIK